MNGELAPSATERRSDGNGGRRSFAGSVSMFGASLMPVVLAGCLLLSWGASVAVPLGTSIRSGSADGFLGGAVYLVWVLLVYGVLRRTSEIPEHRVVWALIGLSAVLKLVLAGWAMRLPLHADQELFHRFVRAMADSRLDAGVMRGLSAIYDYPVWAGRVLPIHYGMRLLAGAQDVVGVRLLNVGLSSALLAATYGFARRLLPVGQRKWAVFLMMALPFQTMVVTDYSHHLFSSFYFLVSLWGVWEMVFSSPSPLRRLGLSLGTGVCLLLMMGQRGTHWIALAVWGALLLWALCTGVGWRRWIWMVAGIGILPLALSIPLAHRYDAWLERHDTHRLNSVLPGFVARGWCPKSDGEYCGRYEQLDRVTPWPAKSAAMFRLVGSQIRYNPAVVCLRFPVVKTAKLFLVGYASNFEESLAAADSRALPWARGMRRVAAPLFLGLALGGCLMLARRPGRQDRWLPVVLAPVVTWGAYVFFGETSPRYSIFCQPFLALLGALALSNGGLTAQEGVQGVPPGPWGPVLGRGLVILGGMVGALGLLVAVVQSMPSHRFYGDVHRGWSVSDGGAVGAGPLSPFEAALCLEPGHGSMEAVWAVPSMPEGGTTLSFYLLEVDPDARALTLGVHAGGEDWRWWPLAGRPVPQFVEMDLSPHTEKLEFVLRTADGSPMEASGCVVVGYVYMDRQDVNP